MPLRSRLRKIKPTRPGFLSKQTLVYVASFAVIGGAVMILISHAATNDASFEPELGAVSNGATTAQITGASNGQAVKFAAPNSTITLPSGGTWTNVAGNLSNANDNGWMTLFAPPTGSKVYISLSSGQQGTGIYYSTGGTTWTQTGTGAGSVFPNVMTEQIVFDPNNINNMWIAGIYGSGDTFYSTDGGTTYHSLGNGHSDGIGVDMTNHQLIIEGRHENKGTVLRTTNGGATWSNISGNLPANFGFTQNPYLVDSQTYLIGAFQSWGGGEPGIYRTTNGGASWSKVSSTVAVGYPFKAGNNLYWSSSDYNGSQGVNRSTDNGVTWTQTGNGSGLQRDGQVLGLSDGRLIGLPDDQGSGTRLLTSSNGGNTWTEFGTAMPCKARSYTYSPGQDAIYVSGGNCGHNIWRLK